MAPYEIIVLKEGYSRVVSTSLFEADCTITLLRGEKNILVDTGNPCDKDFLVKALAKHNLTVDAIDYVVGTHGHIDHIGNLNLFPRAVMIVGNDVLKHGDKYDAHDFKSGREYEIDDDVDVISTPGHTSADVSVVVKRSNLGKVVVAGDIFEREEDLDDPSIWMDNSEDTEQQEQSRIKIMSMAEIIIPGHGPPFRLKPDFKRHLSFEPLEREQIEVDISKANLEDD